MKRPIGIDRFLIAPLFPRWATRILPEGVSSESNMTHAKNRYVPERSLTRRDMMGRLGGLALTGLLGKSSPSTARQTPNILFIMADDHAAHALSCYGSCLNTTPNLDRLAREGMRFANCFVTNSLCAPSRATVLTGKYSHQHGTIDNQVPFDGSQPTFPKWLQRAGYRTAVVGKWHLQSDPTGFDYWNILPGQGAYHNPATIEMGHKRQWQGYVTDLITDWAIDFLKSLGNEPFCLLCHHKAPHRGWEPAPRHAALYEERDLLEPHTFHDDYQNRASPAAHADMRIADMPDYVEKGQPPNLSPEKRKKWNYQRFIKDYLRTVAAVDENVGRLLDYLDKVRLAEDTLVIYTSDNGFFLGDHGWFDKRFMYEESIRIPLLVRYPREISAGTVNGHMILNVDFAPTFLAYAGVPIPGDFQGRSLRPLLRGKSLSNWRTSMYYRYYEYPKPHLAQPHYGVRTERYKLIYYHTLDEWELFDLEKDPHEMENAYADPACAEVVQELKAELDRLRQELNDIT